MPVTVSWLGLESAEPAFISEPRIESASPPVRPDVVLVSLDTASPRRFSLHGHSKRTTPRLDRRARFGRVYTRAYAEGAFTTPSHAGMLSGLSPLSQGAVLAPPPPDGPTLARTFRAGGYRTLAVAGGGLVGLNSGLSSGFESFESDRIPTDDAVDRAIERLRATQDPVFLFFHTYEAHAPYERSGETSGEGGGCGPLGSRIDASPKSSLDDGILVIAWMPPLSGLLPAEVCAPMLYDDGIARIDRALDRLLSAVWARRRGVSPIVAVTADHGEMLGEKGLFLHGWDEDLVAHVPLILWGPSVLPGETPDLACGVDIAPTLLSLAGIEVRPGLSGRDLNGSAPPKPCFTFSNYPVPVLTARSARARATLDLVTGRMEAPAAAKQLVAALRGEVARAFAERYVEVVSGSDSLQVDIQTDGFLACLAPPCDSSARGTKVTARATRNRPVRLGVVPGLLRYLSIKHGGRTLDLQLDGALTEVEIGRDGLRPVPSLSPGRSGVRVRWRGKLPSGFDASEARANLKALGYLH